MSDQSITVDERFALHFSKLGPEVRRYLTKLCRNASVAEEISQYTFMKLHSRLTRGDQIGNVTGWVFRVARNKAIDHVRRIRSIAPKVGDMPKNAAERQADHSSSQEEDLLERERAEWLRAALIHLTPRQRACFVLRSKGLKYHEIGARLGMDKRRVAEAVRDATLCLRKHLKKHLHG